ncbi:MAG: lysylphosphatidylglycerol synthase transmembrane domain-containing protein [Acidobacteriota bacterium]
MFHIVVLVIGVVGLALAIHELGWQGVQDAVVGTGPWFAVIALLDLASAACDAYAIRGFILPKQPVSYAAVFAAQASGIAVNRLTPGNSLGEPVKVTMLTTHKVPTNLAVSAVVMFNLVSAYLGIVQLLIGVPVTTLLLDLPHHVVVIVWVATGVLVALAVAAGVLVKRGAARSLVDIVSGMRFVTPERAARWRSRLADIDTRLRDLGRHPRESGLYRGLAGVVASRLLSWCGTIAVLHAAGIALEPRLVVATLSVGMIVSWVSSIVPLGLGIADGANYVMYSLLGASSAAGLAFTMIGRLRTIALALMGLGVMAIAHSSHRVRLARELAA